MVESSENDVHSVLDGFWFYIGYANEFLNSNIMFF